MFIVLYKKDMVGKILHDYHDATLTLLGSAHTNGNAGHTRGFGPGG